MSIALDPLSDLAHDVADFGILSTYLSDRGGEVSEKYGIPLTHGGEPGHIFVLVGQDGLVKWVKDYGAPENGSLMYVETDELYGEVSQRL